MTLRSDLYALGWPLGYVSRLNALHRTVNPRSCIRAPPRTGTCVTASPSGMFTYPLNPATLPTIAPMKMMMMERWVT